MFSEKFDGKVALVTGASRGIGAAVFRALGTAGASVVGTATSESGAAAISEAARAGGFNGRGVVYVAGGSESDGRESASTSGTASESAAALVKDAESAGNGTGGGEGGEGGVGGVGVDILVANAGATSDALLMRMGDAEWDRVLDVNLTSSFHLTRAALRGMMRRRRGRIVLLSSVAAAYGNPGQANYCAAKAGLEGFARSVARESASRGVTVNAVAPGFIETDMTASLPPSARAELLSGVPIGRAGTPEEVASLICFLASDSAAYITGQTLHINGGMLMN